MGTTPKKPPSWRMLLSSAIADAGQELAGGNPADAGKCHQILHTLRQFGIVLAVTANLSYRLKNLLLVKLQAVKQLISLKRTVPEQASLRSLSLTKNDH